jgi:hypothetical protein
LRYLMLRSPEQETLLGQLQAMPEFLAERFGDLSARDATAAGAGGTFSPAEHCWHLADLEREGFGARIQRLRAEQDPFLPDFDGARIAQTRRYKEKPLAEGIEVFRQARTANIAALRSVAAEEWVRRGTQEGVGRVALCDIPSMMAEHDAIHRSEIETWTRGTRP